jgi:hypothetical protein
MGEDAPSADLAAGEVDYTREGGSAGTGEPDELGHGIILSTRRQLRYGVTIDRKMRAGRPSLPAVGRRRRAGYGGLQPWLLKVLSAAALEKHRHCKYISIIYAVP